MNATLRRFNHPAALVREFEHWVVLIRPVQPTPLSCVIAARADVNSLGELEAAAGAQLPAEIAGFEAAVRRVAPAVRFNYLALMMVDPNPHFHAIPRYAAALSLDGIECRDTDFPRPVDVLRGLEIDAATLDRWRALLADRWTR
ncbi:HIT family protein [Azohydromonas caseinilytica]|uniref:HIT family protein n=1 Tax=Azohydromonas caseinilytica TaxID=2728836 RepID=A0A848F9T3_9BURK|nr:HIT family protein [Azohydromonas caseinilytica]NML16082.1 HIT family protein [Azohydromonas caseinilytica]